MRSVPDMIAALDAPIAPGTDAAGWPLADLDACECRFPVAHGDDGVRFCGASVELERWIAGGSGGRYCAFHHAYLRGQPAVGQGRDG